MKITLSLIKQIACNRSSHLGLHRQVLQRGGDRQAAARPHEGALPQVPGDVPGEEEAGQPHVLLLRPPSQSDQRGRKRNLASTWESSNIVLHKSQCCKVSISMNQIVGTAGDGNQGRGAD